MDLKTKPTMKNLIEKLILTRSTDWVFDDQVSQIFDKHVRNSVPCYDIIQELISFLSVVYLTDGSIVYDLGTSTGEVIFRINHKNQKKKIKYIGIDNAPAMLQMAAIKCKKIKDVHLVCESLEDFIFKEKSDLIVSSFCLQFLQNDQRIPVLKNIKKSLTEKGIFILCEKIVAEDESIDKKFVDLYERWKLKHFTQQEINNKKKSLMRVMKPISLNQNISQLNEAGFERVYPFFQWCNFIGLIAK
jgi:tRNA (cmo5U34)-methyltransferase